MVKIHIKEGDPILTMNYAKYYLNVIDDGVERKRFFTEVDLCRIHNAQIQQRKLKALIGIDPKKMVYLQNRYTAIQSSGRNQSPSDESGIFNKSKI